MHEGQKESYFCSSHRILSYFLKPEFLYFRKYYVSFIIAEQFFNTNRENVQNRFQKIEHSVSMWASFSRF